MHSKPRALALGNSFLTKNNTLKGCWKSRPPLHLYTKKDPKHFARGLLKNISTYQLRIKHLVPVRNTICLCSKECICAIMNLD